MSETPVTLAEETLLRVKQLEDKFVHFETDTNMTDICLIEIDEELEEGRVSLEKLEKRVTVLETDLPELFEERLAVLKTENAELRVHLNLVVDAVNNITRVWNEQVVQVIDNEPPDEVKVVDGDDELTTEDNQPPQLTLQQVCDMYQSQPPDEEGWEEMTKAIQAALEYEDKLQKQQELPARVITQPPNSPTYPIPYGSEPDVFLPTFPSSPHPEPKKKH